MRYWRKVILKVDGEEVVKWSKNIRHKNYIIKQLERQGHEVEYIPTDLDGNKIEQ